MEGCCAAPVAAGACPSCGSAGTAVDLLTVKAMLRPSTLARLNPGSYRFCPSAVCSIVYFSTDSCLEIADVAVRVFQKEPPGARTVCYCFSITESDIAADLHATGQTSAVDRVSGFVRADRCACEIKNPQGRCCLGNLAGVIRSLEGSRSSPAGLALEEKPVA